MKIPFLFFLICTYFHKCFSDCLKKESTFVFYITPDFKMNCAVCISDIIWKKKQRKNDGSLTKYFMKRLRNATVEIDVENRKDLSKIEIIKMFMKGVKDCKNVEILKERLKGHVPRTTRRKLMKQKRLMNLRMHIKNCQKKKAEAVPPEKNILHFPKDKLKEINAAVLYFRRYFEKFEKENEEKKKGKEAELELEREKDRKDVDKMNIGEAEEKE